MSAPVPGEPKPFVEPRWIVCYEDVNRLREWAGRNHIGDSATAIRRLLDQAEAAESPAPGGQGEQAPFSEAAREAAARAMDPMYGRRTAPGGTQDALALAAAVEILTAAVNADPRAKAFLELARLSDEELVERAKRAIDAAVGGALDDDELEFYARIPLAALGLPVDEQETTG